IAAREAEIQKQRDELQRLSAEREESERRRVEAENARTAAIAEAERRRGMAEAQSEQLRQQVEQERSKLAQTRTSDRGFIVTLPGLFFDSGKSVLKAGAKNTLTKIAEQLRINEDTRIAVEGHTDSVGSDA